MHNLLFVLSHALVFPQQPNIYLEIVGNSNSEKDWAFLLHTKLSLLQINMLPKNSR